MSTATTPAARGGATASIVIRAGDDLRARADAVVAAAESLHTPVYVGRGASRRMTAVRATRARSLTSLADFLASVCSIRAVRLRIRATVHALIRRPQSFATEEAARSWLDSRPLREAVEAAERADAMVIQFVMESAVESAVGSPAGGSTGGGRVASVSRDTSETKITVLLNLDGTGKADVATGA